MLGSKKISDPAQEELVLNIVASLTNLLYYDSVTNLLFQPETKMLLCRLARPLLLESCNLEAIMEISRALGNLSRHKDTRRVLRDLGLDEIVCVHLDVQDHIDLLY